MSESAATVDDIEAVAGDFQEGRTVELLLEDDRVLVTRVRQVQGGPVPCRVDGCFRRFESERGMESHIGKMHPDERRRECPTCGDDFNPRNAEQVYCSQECYYESGRETLECEHCGDEFVIKQSHAENRRHCSQECYEAHADEESVHERSHTRIERICPECEEPFEVYPSNDQKFCSMQCLSDSRRVELECDHCEQKFELPQSNAENRRFCTMDCRRAAGAFGPAEGSGDGPAREERVCEQCGEPFEVHPSLDQKFCSTDCHHEAHRKTLTCPTCRDEFTIRASGEREYCSQACYYESGKLYDRPQTAAGLLHELQEEGFGQYPEKLGARAYAHLAPEWERFEVVAAVLMHQDGPPRDYERLIAALRERDDLDPPAEQRALLDRVVRVACQLINESIDHVGAAELLTVLEEASTMLEVQQRWRVCRSDARRIVSLLGVHEDVTSGEQEAFQRAKEVLEEDGVEFGAGGTWDQSMAGGQSDD